MTKLQCAFCIFFFFFNTLQERCVSSAVVLKEWLSVTGMNAASSPCKERFSFFRLGTKKKKEQQLFVGMPHSCEIALVVNKTT